MRRVIGGAVAVILILIFLGWASNNPATVHGWFTKAGDGLSVVVSSIFDGGKHATDNTTKHIQKSTK